MHRGKMISARKFPHVLNTAHSIHYDIPLSEIHTALLLADSSKPSTAEYYDYSCLTEKRTVSDSNKLRPAHRVIPVLFHHQELKCLHLLPKLKQPSDRIHFPPVVTGETCWFSGYHILPRRVLSARYPGLHP